MHARHSRTLRGATAAAVATWTAAVSHTLGGGSFPAPALILVVTALAAPIAVALAGRRLGLGRLVVTVIAAQALLHVGFAATAGLDPSAPTGHVHAGALPLTGGFASLVPDAGMTVAHAVAALLTIAVLFRGEQLLRLIARGVRDVFARAIVRLPAPASRVPLVSSVPDAPRLTPFTAVVSRRGPPSFVTAAL